MVRILSIIRSSFAFLLSLVPNDALRTIECVGNLLQGIFLRQQYLNLIALALREVLSRTKFFIRSVYQTFEFKRPVAEL